MKTSHQTNSFRSFGRLALASLALAAPRAPLVEANNDAIQERQLRGRHLLTLAPDLEEEYDQVLRLHTRVVAAAEAIEYSMDQGPPMMTDANRSDFCDLLMTGLNDLQTAITSAQYYRPDNLSGTIGMIQGISANVPVIQCGVVLAAPCVPAQNVLLLLETNRLMLSQIRSNLILDDLEDRTDNGGIEDANSEYARIFEVFTRIKESSDQIELGIRHNDDGSITNQVILARVGPLSEDLNTLQSLLVDAEHYSIAALGHVLGMILQIENEWLPTISCGLAATPCATDLETKNAIQNIILKVALIDTSLTAP